MEGSEFALTSALLAVLGSVVYYSWTGSKPTSQQPEGSRAASTYTRPKLSTKRGKKRRINETSSFVPASTDHDDSAMETSPSDARPKYSKPSPATPRVVVQRSVEATIPGGLAPLLSASEMESTHSAGSSASKSAQKKKKKAPKKEKPIESENERMHPGGLMLAPPPPPPNVPSSKQKGSPQSYRHETSEASEFDSGREWMIVDKGKSRRGRGGAGHMESASDTGVTTSVTEEEGSVASVSQPPSATRERGNTLTSAQKLLPKTAETKVDDMLEGPKPGIARVMRVTGTSSVEGTDAEGFGADGEEDPTWSIVPVKQRGGSGTPSNSRQNTATAASSSSGPTKKQKYNAKQREAEKAAKEAEEKDRQERLRQHRKEQEKARIADASRGSTNKNTLSGGQQAKLDSNGKLVWD
ncbi:hypothetical protein M408DRAFT_20095 [Serendipita vermifera MAFF 305830]|uniref:Uncharacterized protein n=1 Tax=Serendipita vermifera MAFF 305830 TaxID=933852 RepID=A0A0C2XV23_SERVB|nr:hypothetical protein M408DRAFT_20095 [Serendipita vermifera MAFF 305830]